MPKSTQRIFVWCGPAMLVVLFIGLIVAGWIPLPTPGDSAAKVAHDYQAHTDAIRIGLLIAMFGAALYGPFAAMLAAQLRRMEKWQPAATYCQLMLGGLVILEVIVPLMILEAAAFRPYRSPEITLAISDIGWLMFVGFVFTVVVELVFLGVAILQDTTATPVFPRWTGTASIVTAVLILPGTPVVAFKSGPFTWSGILGFWVPAIAFGPWLVVMSVFMLKNIDREGDIPVPTATVAETAAAMPRG